MNKCEHCQGCLFYKLYYDTLHLVKRVADCVLDWMLKTDAQKFEALQDIKQRADYIYSQHEVKDVR